ncbi:uncharacterized protein LTR77_007294 [Saxophila tyrrhenica]|uniref:Uncharacterized protein n=1 Tax=Saxophila tyrrhenica TaxID=1690608 RepID=A0AAV9P509_9PEZI|nr:hypothetical protein LTR77_007294 [Saxophila tyrrhenica]
MPAKTDKKKKRSKSRSKEKSKEKSRTRMTSRGYERRRSRSAPRDHHKLHRKEEKEDEIGNGPPDDDDSDSEHDEEAEPVCPQRSAPQRRRPQQDARPLPHRSYTQPHPHAGGTHAPQTPQRGAPPMHPSRGQSYGGSTQTPEQAAYYNARHAAPPPVPSPSYQYGYPPQYFSTSPHGPQIPRSPQAAQFNSFGVPYSMQQSVPLGYNQQQAYAQASAAYRQSPPYTPHHSSYAHPSAGYEGSPQQSCHRTAYSPHKSSYPSPNASPHMRRSSASYRESPPRSNDRPRRSDVYDIYGSRWDGMDYGMPSTGPKLRRSATASSHVPYDDTHRRSPEIPRSRPSYVYDDDDDRERRQGGRTPRSGGRHSRQTEPSFVGLDEYDFQRFDGQRGHRSPEREHRRSECCAEPETKSRRRDSRYEADSDGGDGHSRSPDDRQYATPRRARSDTDEHSRPWEDRQPPRTPARGPEAESSQQPRARPARRGKPDPKKIDEYQKLLNFKPGSIDLKAIEQALDAQKSIKLSRVCRYVATEDPFAKDWQSVAQGQTPTPEENDPYASAFLLVSGEGVPRDDPDFLHGVAAFALLAAQSPLDKEPVKRKDPKQLIPDTVSLSWFCRHVGEGQDILSMMRSLIGQLLSHGDMHAPHEAPPKTFDKMLDFLKHCIVEQLRARHILCVIDSLHVYSGKECIKLVEALAAHTKGRAGDFKVRLIITALSSESVLSADLEPAQHLTVLDHVVNEYRRRRAQ